MANSDFSPNRPDCRLVIMHNDPARSAALIPSSRSARYASMGVKNARTSTSTSRPSRRKRSSRNTRSPGSAMAISRPRACARPDR